MVSFLYYSHTIPIFLGILMGVVSGMGIVWVRGPMSLGVPENPSDFFAPLTLRKWRHFEDPKNTPKRCY